jgi:glycosyltransferase involved in cell wall biosynthesis
MELSIVMPCLNEAETLAVCIQKAQTFLVNNHINGEVIIGDNGSTDGSQDIAKNLGAIVVHIETKGYGSASIGAIEKAKGIYIITADTDDSHDILNLMPFLEQLRNGSDLVIGNRFKGDKQKDAMPFLHRYVGNPVLTFVGNLFFKTSIGDFHCGLKGFTKEAFYKMNLRTTGMEFASEIVVKASLLKLKITEVPTVVFPAGRSRKPHLRTFPDGWRHLRFLLLYSPSWLFLYPAVLMMVVGLAASLTLIIKPVFIEGVVFNIHTLMYSSSLVLIGFQFLMFYALTKIFAVENGLLPKSNRYNKFFKFLNLEKGLLVGVLILIVGFILSYKGLSLSMSTDFSAWRTEIFRLIIPAVFTILLGIQIILFSLFFSILGLKNSD